MRHDVKSRNVKSSISGTRDDQKMAETKAFEVRGEETTHSTVLYHSRS